MMLCQIPNFFTHLNKVMSYLGLQGTDLGEVSLHKFIQRFIPPSEDGWLLSGRSLTEHSY